MTCIQAIGRSFRVPFKHGRTITFLWTITFLLGYLLLHPYIKAISKFFSTSGINDLFMSKNFTMLSGDFANFNPSASTMFYAAIVLGLLLYVLISIGTNGGLMALILNRREGRISGMLYHGFKYYKHLFIIWLINLLMSFGLLFFGGIILGIVVAIGDFSSEVPYFISFVSVAVPVFLLWLVKDFITDFLKFFLFKNLDDGPGIHFGKAFAFTMKRLPRLLIFAILMLLILAVILLIGHLIGGLFSSFNFLLVLGIIVAQIIIWLRIAWRVWFWAGEREFMEEQGGELSVE